MKKFLLFTPAVILLIIAVCGASIANLFFVPVNVCRIKEDTYMSNIYLSGTIENPNIEKVMLSAPVIAAEIYIKPGDLVKKGERLFSVDKSATILALENASALLTSKLPSSDYMKYSDVSTEYFAQSDGVVTAVNISKIDLSNPSEALVTISPTDTLQIKSYISENNVNKITLGDKAVINGAAFSDKEYYGEVTWISGSARKMVGGTSQETVVDIIISIENPDNTLRTGYSAKVSIETAPPVSLPYIPYECVNQDESGNWYACVLDGGKAVYKRIEIGRSMKNGLEILSGVGIDDSIILLDGKEIAANSFVKIGK